MLKLKKIVKHYYIGDNVVEALKGVDLEFRKSEFVSILGPSGCGKTTLLNIIGGLDRYTSGDLIINQKSTKDFNDYDWDSYRNHSIGFVFQNYNLISHVSVLRNVELALTLSGIGATERRNRATEALEKVGLRDQINKKPNQLSGGQMQRVAIARALVNNPDILLADEPTGALDTATSSQIMDILKEISKDRLIIMVTHNPVIASTYSTRIINLLDGLVISDSNPYHSQEEMVKTKTKRQKEKTSMSFITALLLSLGNLFTKKTRTLLTAFAGSIGIIGIALVLAISNGFQGYINKMQGDTMSSYPLTISQSAIDYERFMTMNRRNDLKEFPEDKIIYVNKISELAATTRISNDITNEYITNVIEKIDKNLYNAINYQYGVRLNIFRTGSQTGINYFQRLSTGSWAELIEDEGLNDKYQFIKNQYDVIHGRLPNNKNELVIVVDKYNQITDNVLSQLGLYDPSFETYTFDDFIGINFKLILNNQYYGFDGTKFTQNAYNSGNRTFISEEIYLDQNNVELEIVGIVRVNPETSQGTINGTIGYTKELTDYVLDQAESSQIITWMNNETNYSKDPFTGTDYIIQDRSIAEQRKTQLNNLGGNRIPTQINIYPVDFNSKEKIKTFLDTYNDEAVSAAIADYYQMNNINPSSASLEQRIAAEAFGHGAGIYYTDSIQFFVNTFNKLINGISYVLIAFTAVSLVVSSIMIGIITYISVLERTKEIGILRSIGARKKDISRVFNAETIIIGFTSGIMGVVITLILSIPINIIIYHFVEIENVSTLNIFHGFILILISMFLTLIAGLIPSQIAAKRDPVIALRTE